MRVEGFSHSYEKTRETTHQLQHPQHRIDVPPAIGSESLGGSADLGRHAQLELVVGHLEESEKLAGEHANVGLVDEGVGELESTTTNGDVAVAEAVEDDGAVALYSVGIHSNDLIEGVEGDVAVGAG